MAEPFNRRKSYLSRTNASEPSRVIGAAAWKGPASGAPTQPLRLLLLGAHPLILAPRWARAIEP